MKKMFSAFMIMLLVLFCTACGNAESAVAFPERYDADSLQKQLLVNEKYQLSGLEWGISRAEAEERLGFTLEEVKPMEETGIEGQVFAEHSADFWGCTGKIRLAFKDDRMYLVTLMMDGEDMQAQHDMLYANMEEAFGKPSLSSEMDEDDVVQNQWRRESTLLFLRYGEDTESRVMVLLGNTEIW